MNGIPILQQAIADDTSDTVTLLRRVVKLLESNAVVDIQGRQKVIVDSAALLSAINIAAGSAGVPSVNGPTALAPIQSAAQVWLPVWTGPIDNRWLVIDQARNTYANSIRNNLTFS